MLRASQWSTFGLKRKCRSELAAHSRDMQGSRQVNRCPLQDHMLRVPVVDQARRGQLDSVAAGL